jgi:hypothetical protein
MDARLFSFELKGYTYVPNLDDPSKSSTEPFTRIVNVVAPSRRLAAAAVEDELNDPIVDLSKVAGDYLVSRRLIDEKPISIIVSVKH